MYLKSLEIKGFKSFVRKTSLAFEPGVVIIVGPNGSGKSNIADAVMWVLGEQSPTSLRGGRMEDVIFSGSTGHRPVNLAEVTLVLDNSRGDFPLDFSEVSITRNVVRGGDSEYLLNNTPCRLLDIQELLSDAGVGRTLNSVISQGNLDQVLNCRPEERRDYVEEAGGLLKFRRRREKAQRRIEKMKDELERVGGVTRELKRQLRPLEKQAERLEKYTVLAAELTEARLRLDVTRLTGMQAQWQSHVDSEKEREERAKSVEAQIARLSSEVRAIEDAADARRLRESALRDELYRLVAVDETLKAMLPSWEERRRLAAGGDDGARAAGIAERIGELEELIEASGAALAEARDKYEEASHEAGRSRSELENGAREKAVLQARLEVLEGDAPSSAANVLRERVAGMERLQSERHGLARAEEEAVIARDAAREAVTSLIMNYREAASAIERVVISLRDAAADLRMTGSEPETMEQRLVECSEKVDSLSLDLERSRATFSGQAKALADALRELSKLEDLVATKSSLLAALDARIEFVREDAEALASPADGDSASSCREKLVEAGARLEELEETAGSLGARFEAASERMRAASAEHELLERELSSARDALSRMEQGTCPGTEAGPLAEVEALERLHFALAGQAARARASVIKELEESPAAGSDSANIRAQRDTIAELMKEHESLRELVHADELGMAELKVKVEQLVERIVDGHKVPLDFALKQYADESPALELEAKVESLAGRMEHIGPVNPEALADHASLAERHSFYTEQMADIEHASGQLKRVIKEIDSTIELRFKQTVDAVDSHFREIFAQLFPGGAGEIRLTDPDDLLNSGIEIYVRPEGKTLRRLSLLSGGETSLSALAFFFALFRVRPSPFYFLDEVEAALDDVNLHRFLDMVREFRKESQLILITHQKRSMEIADILYGVSMQEDGVSKVVSRRMAG